MSSREGVLAQFCVPGSLILSCQEDPTLLDVLYWKRMSCCTSWFLPVFLSFFSVLNPDWLHLEVPSFVLFLPARFSSIGCCWSESRAACLLISCPSLTFFRISPLFRVNLPRAPYLQFSFFVWFLLLARNTTSVKIYHKTWKPYF